MNDIKEDIAIEDKGIEITIDCLLDLNVDASTAMEESKRYSTSSSTYTSYQRSTIYNCECDTRSVYFFELSDLNRTPLFFNKVSSFVSWAKENGVMLSEDKIQTLKRMPTSYSVCKKGSPTIITRVSKYMLEQAINNNYYQTSSVGASQSYRNECSYPYNDYYDDYYNDWD